MVAPKKIRYIVVIQRLLQKNKVYFGYPMVAPNMKERIAVAEGDPDLLRVAAKIKLF